MEVRGDGHLCAAFMMMLVMGDKLQNIRAVTDSHRITPKWDGDSHNEHLRYSW